MINFKYLSSGNEERIYSYLNNLSNCQGCFCSKVYIRFLHAVASAPAVDIIIDGSIIATNLKYTQVTNYILTYQGSYDLLVYAAGDRSNPLINKTISLNKNMAYTIAIAGTVSEPNSYLIREYKEEKQPVAQSIITFTNLSNTKQNQDLYLSDGTLVYKDVAFTQTMPNVLILPTQEAFAIKAVNTDTVLARTPVLELKRDTYYALYSMGENNIILLPTISGLNYLDIC